jgi:hypothetical protein
MGGVVREITRQEKLEMRVTGRVRVVGVSAAA